MVDVILIKIYFILGRVVDQRYLHKIREILFMEDSKLSFRLIYVYLNNYYLERHDDLVENMGQELDRLFSIWVILNKSCNFFEIM